MNKLWRVFGEALRAAVVFWGRVSMRLARSFSIAAACVLSSFPGCADYDDLPREAISGSVNLSGKPLEGGTIQFQPKTNGISTVCGAGISNGQYTISRSEGLVPGKYQVLIYGVVAQTEPATATPTSVGDTPPKRGAKEPIPQQYNSKSVLTAEVTKGGPNKFDFELTDK
jgi:hypothetical protein